MPPESAGTAGPNVSRRYVDGVARLSPECFSRVNHHPFGEWWPDKAAAIARLTLAKVSRFIGSWLSGPRAAQVEQTADAEPGYRGERLGMPESGVGAIPGFGRRLLALIVDWIPCAVAANFLTTNPPLSALALFALLTVVTMSVFQRTPGHALLGIKVTSLGSDRVSFPQVIIRTLLLCLVLPPLVSDVDGRGLHDHAARTVLTMTR